MDLIEATSSEWSAYCQARDAWRKIADRPVGDPERKAAWDSTVQAWKAYEKAAECYWRMKHLHTEEESGAER